jgi:hypothetical protein
VRPGQEAAVATAATAADDARSALLAGLLRRVARCFPRRETRQACGHLVSGPLMELDDHNRWTIAKAAGLPEEVIFATKPQLADALLDRTHRLGIRAAFVAGDEVYGGRELRRRVRQREMGM